MKIEVGQRFSRLLILERVRGGPCGKVWKCQCDCRNISYKSTSELKSGNHKSCGCLRRENFAAQVKPLINGKKLCPICNQLKRATEFPKNDRNQCGRGTYCFKCRKVRYLMTDFGLSLEECLRLRNERINGKCAVCKATENLHLDHNHKTNQMRGILCGNHNRALGLVNESIEVLKAMIDYLVKYEG